MTRRRRMNLFFAVNSLYNMAASFAHPVSPTIYSNLGVGSYMFGVALGSMLVVNFLFSPFWGKINNYISSRKSLLICCFGYSLGQLFFALSASEGQIIVARMFAGVFTGGGFVSLLTYVVNKSINDQDRGRNLAVSATIIAIGGAFGFLIGGLLGEIFTYLAFIAQIITLAICGVLFFVVCEDDAKYSLKDIDSKRLIKEMNPFAAFWESRKFLNAFFVMLFAMCMLQNLANTTFDQTFNYYIRDQFNFSSGYNGVLKGTMGVITLISNATVTMWIIKKTNIKLSAIFVLMLCSITTLGIVLTDHIVLFLIINVACFAVAATVIPLLQALVAERAIGEHQNLIMGVYNSMRSLGGIVGAFSSGILYTINPKMPFIFSCVAFLLAMSISILYYFKCKRNDVKHNESNC